MEDHHAAAHLVAKHLRAIAALLPRLSEEGLNAYLPGLGRGLAVVLPEYCAMQEHKANLLEATAPFTPLTEEETTELYSEMADECDDMRAAEMMVDALTDDWTPAEWRMEKDDRNSYMQDLQW